MIVRDTSPAIQTEITPFVGTGVRPGAWEVDTLERGKFRLRW